MVEIIVCILKLFVFFIFAKDKETEEDRGIFTVLSNIYDGALKTAFSCQLFSKKAPS